MIQGHDGAAGDETRSLPLLEHLDSLCDAFEESWKAGIRPRLEQYLEDTTVPGAELLVELVQIDIDYRRRYGERPTLEEYTEKFPQFEASLSQIVLPSVPEERAAETVPIPVRPLPMLGRFQLGEQIGRGTFGTVWQAWDTRMKRWVALKQFHEGLTRSHRKQFEAEVQAASQIDHPNVVRVLEPSEGTATDFIVFELIDGESLRSWLAAREGKPVEPRLAARIVLQVARGLEQVHSRNVVHRDIKPGNILLTKNGVAKLADFGLARHLDSISTNAHSNAMAGTIPYMSPEQCRAGKVTAATDIYSLGVVLYELLAGSRPFSGTPAELMALILQGAPALPPDATSPRSDLARIAHRAMAIETTSRYSTAGELAADLDRFLKGEEIARQPPAPPQKPPHRFSNRFGLLAGALGLVLGVGLAGLGGLALFGAFAPIDDGRLRVRLNTEPSGAAVTFIPLDAGSGRPWPEGKTSASAISPVDLRLEPGDYLVVAQLKDNPQRFHEVYRHVPSSPSGFQREVRHLTWTPERDGISLPRIRIPEEDITSGMALVDEAERFPVAGAGGGGEGSSRFCRIPAFYVDPREYTVGENKKFQLDHHIRLSGPQSIAAMSPKFHPAANDTHAENLTWDEAVDRMESLGKRLLDEWEYELIATARGTSPYPWGRDLPRFELTAEAPGPVGTPEFDRVRSHGVAIEGLGSNVAEWVDSSALFGPKLRPINALSAGRDADMRPIRGGDRLQFDKDRSLRPAEPQPNMRSSSLRVTRHPGLGVRGARSARPRLTPEDFVRILPQNPDPAGTPDSAPSAP